MENRRRDLILLIIFLTVAVLGTIGYLTAEYLSNRPKLPEGNIKIQSQMINDGSISLRNAYYTEDEIKVGYEVKGFSMKEYNISCKLYSDGNLITTSGSTGGGLIELDEKHYYLTGIENLGQINLPESINLTVEISLIPNDNRQETLTTSFDVSLDKETK